MTTLWMSNFVAYSLQIGALIGGSALLIRLLRVHTPSVRLAWFQLVLLVCLLLPVLQPWNSARAVTHASPRGANKLTFSMPAEGSSRPASLAFRDLVLPVLGAGAAVRLLWTLLGFWCLRRYRRASRSYELRLPVAGEFARRAGITSGIGISEKIGGPITFGLFSPLILLPSHFERMNAGTQEAILCHELIHVRRRDWLVTVAEEVILAALWFHPAAWWLISQIRLAREQTVDLQVIEITGSRERYLEALVEAARAGNPGALMPVTSFLWRRQLVRRVSAIVDSAAAMSRRRLVPSLGVALVGSLLVIRMAVMSFPLSSAAAQQPSGDAIQIESGDEHLLHRGAIEYPGYLIERQVEGLVVVEVTTDGDGTVADLHVVAGPQQLRRTVLQSVMTWVYDPKLHPAGTTQVAIHFRLPRPGSGSATLLPAFASGSTEMKENAERSARGEMMENAEKIAKGQLTGKLISIRFHGPGEPTRLEWVLPIRIGDRVDAESFERLQQSVCSRIRDSHLGAEMNPAGEISLHIFSEESDH